MDFLHYLISLNQNFLILYTLVAEIKTSIQNHQENISSSHTMKVSLELLVDHGNHEAKEESNASEHQGRVQYWISGHNFSLLNGLCRQVGQICLAQ